MLETAREADPKDPQSTASRLMGAGVPRELARDLGAAHDEVMSQSILDFYRSAAPTSAPAGGRGSRARLARGDSCCFCLILPKWRRCRWRWLNR
jgi:hypothetical protein